MNKVAKNSAWIISCKVVQSVFALIISMLIARYLGPANYGLITYASSITAFVAPIMTLGFSNTIVRELVAHPSSEGSILGTALVYNCLSAIVCILGILLFVHIANPNETVTLIVCFLYSFVLLFQAVELITYWFQAHLLSKYTSIISLLAYIIVSIYRIMLLVSHKSIYWFAIANAFDYALIAFSSLYIYKRLGGQKYSFSSETGKWMFNNSKYYIVSSMMVTIFAQTDKIMIKLILDETMTGYYGAAVYSASLFSFVVSAIIDSFRPAIFEAQGVSQKSFENRLAMLYSLIIYISLLQSILIATFAPLIIRILYGSEFLRATSSLRIVVWYTTFAYLGSVRNIWILANNQQRYLWVINLSGAFANIVLNLLLIPGIGIEGAAIASLITQIFTNVIIGFIIAPIRGNNRIMVMGCNPRYVLEIIKQIVLKQQ